ncbi:MAG: ASKHA domain-containing protein [Victivallales bacterium]|nr:ASKHA domain-containing protein [Victivallales bacterium]
MQRKNKKKSTLYKVTVYPRGKIFYEEEDTNLFVALANAGLPVTGSCGGMGICGKCSVKITEGLLPPKDTEKNHLTGRELSEGWRLACKQNIDRNITVVLKEYVQTMDAKVSMQKKVSVELNPGIIKTYKQFPIPVKNDNLPDTERVTREIFKNKNITYSFYSLRKLPYELRRRNFKATVIHSDSQIFDIQAGKKRNSMYGIAVDIGTTTIAVYLLNLITGEEIAVRSSINPQKRLGADVITRIKYLHDNGKKGMDILRKSVVSGINSLIHQVCTVIGTKTIYIYKATVVGNPIMLHFFTGVSPAFIDHSPYNPVFRNGMTYNAGQLKLAIHKEALVQVFPSISGYVGGDITSGVLYTEMHKRKKLSLFIDIGTNAEIVLGNNENMIACSAPAGPAFEGACNKYGMSALPGAVNHASILNYDSSDGLKLDVIGNIQPKGICGSGIIDLTTIFCQLGLLNKAGTFINDGQSPYSCYLEEMKNKQLQFMVSDDPRHPVYLTQQDIREVQLAKGAIRSGIDILLKEYQIEPHEIETVYLAGAFGNFIKRESVLQLGMLPRFPVDVLVQVGNAAGEGAKLALLNKDKWDEVNELSDRIEYFGLSSHEKFSEIFMKSMYFPVCRVSN